MDYYGQALRHLDMTVPKRMAGLVPRFVRDFGAVLLWLWAPALRGKRHPATEGEREINDIIHRRAQAQVTTDPARYLFEAMSGLRRLNRLEPETVADAANQYSIASAIFSLGGLSFASSARMLEIAEKLANPDDVTQYGVYRFMDFLHHSLAGELDAAREMDAELVDDCIRYGLFWHITNYLCFAAEKRTYRGEFPEALAVMERLDKMFEQYDYDFARTTWQATSVYLLREKRDLAALLEMTDRYYADNREDLLNIIALSVRAEVECWMGRPAEAAQVIDDAEQIVKRTRAAPAPYYASFYTRARLTLDLSALEREESPGRALRRRARGHAKSALRTASRVVWRRPEVRKLAALVDLYEGNGGRARAGLEAALADAERMKLGPELGRISK